MTRETTLARGRLAAEAGMVDACTIQRGATVTTNSDIGVVSRTFTTIYSGQCKLQNAGAAFARPTDVGQAQVFLTRMELHVPVTAPVAQPDDLLTITACAHDPDMVGRQWHIRGMPDKSWVTAHRYNIELVTG